MAEKQWPPAWWPFPLKDDSWLAVIPYMDAMQWLYESSKAVANMIPHQPPALVRDVQGYVLALDGSRNKMSLGTVGYDAVARKVTISVNKMGGTEAKTISIDVSVVFPMLTVLLTRLPWDVVGELNSAVMSNMTDAEKSRYAANGISDNKMIIRWLTDKVRAIAGDNDISLPVLNGSYASTDKMAAEGAASLVPSLSNLVLYNIPVIDYCQAIYDAVMELVETINHHPPAASFPVIARGFYPVFSYGIHDSETAVIPAPESVSGDVSVRLRMFADNSVTDWNDLSDPEKTYDAYGQLLDDGKSAPIELVSKSFGYKSVEVTFTSQTDEPDPGIVKKAKMCLITDNAGIYDMEVLEVKQGHEAIEADEANNIEAQPAEPTVFRARIDIRNALEEPVDIAPALASLSAASFGSGNAELTATALEAQASSVSVGDAVTGLPEGLAGVVTEVIGAGSDGPEEADVTETGEGAVAASVRIRITGTASEDVELARDTELPLTIGGEDFMACADRDYTFTAVPSLTYTAEADGPTLMQLPPAEFDVEVATPLYNAGTFYRWRKPEDVQYVGRELNLQLGLTGAGAKRYVIARMKYRYACDKPGHYRYEYSDENLMPDGGNCHPMDIKYNAATKTVTFADRLGGDVLNMRLSACVWFAMQLLMLIPVTVI